MKTFIKALELHGFKSFAKPTKIIFQPGINAIIGPNGSGKSNIVDALCFVLGKSKKKELRTEKFKNLIFNGGKGGKPAKFAKVTLVLDNSEKVFPIEENELRISRKVDYLGRVVYRIRGRRATRSEVLSLLSYANIQPEGYNIVLQGEIDELATMNSEERRKIIDDLAGISTYEEKKEKALRELQKVEEKIREATVLLEEKEKYLRDLKKDKEKAEEYVNLAQKKKEYEAMLLLKEIHLLKGEKEKLEKKVRSITSLIQKIKERSTKIEKKINELVEREKGLIEELNSLKASKENLEKELLEKRVKANELKLSLENSDKEIRRIEERREQILTSIKEIQARIEKLNKEKEEIEGRISKLRDEISKLESISKVEIKEDLSKLREELNQVYEDSFKFKEKLSKLEENRRKIEEIERVSKELKELKEKLEKITERENILVEEVESLSNKLRESLAKKNRLEAKLFSLRELKKGKLPRSVQEILKLRDSGKIDGIIGTISELIKIKEGFERPIAALLRGKESIVIVEDEDTAKECIEFLRRNKIGVASFLPINRIKGIYKEKDGDLGEDVMDLAINLVEYDEKFRDVVYWFLGNCVVVRELPRGKISWKVATLDGKVLERSQLITGGFLGEELAPKIREVEEELKKIEEEVTKYSQSLSEKTSQRESILKERIEIEGEISRRERLLREAKPQEFDPKEIERVRRKIKELEEKRKLLVEKINKYVEIVSKPELLEKLEKLRKELAKLEGEKSKVEGEIKNVLLRDLKNLKRLLKSLEKEKKNFNLNLKKIAREKNSLLKKIEEIKKELEKVEERMRKKEVERESALERISRFKEVKGKNEFRVAELEKRIEEIKKKVSVLDASIKEKRAKFLEYGLEVEVPSLPLDKIKERISELGKKLESYGYVNLKALEIYKSVEEEYLELEEKVRKINEEKDKILKLIEEVESRFKDVYMVAVSEPLALEPREHWNFRWRGYNLIYDAPFFPWITRYGYKWDWEVAEKVWNRLSLVAAQWFERNKHKFTKVIALATPTSGYRKILKRIPVEVYVPDFEPKVEVEYEENVERIYTHPQVWSQLLKALKGTSS